MDLSGFGPGYVDVDEWRDAPLRHRYLHGGFEGTDTRFSVYLPPPEQYSGRFVQQLEGGSAGHETTIMAGGPLADGALSHAFALGAYLVESNQGHIADEPSRPKAGGSVCSYEASVATARYAKTLAADRLGTEPHHGYVYGVSGGGVRSIVCLERGEGTWDGAVPCAIPHSGMFYALAEHASRMLGDKVDAVVDATDVGGLGDPFAGLDVEQREALADLYRAGYARGAEFMLRPGYSPVGYGMTSLYAHDPGYFEAFWNEPGYLGHDRPQWLDRWRVETKATVARVLTVKELVPPGTEPAMAARMAQMMGGPDAAVAAVLDGLTEEDKRNIVGSTITFGSGRGVARTLYCTGFTAGVVTASSYTMGEVFDGVEPGDQVLLDNRHHIAFRYSYRHQAAVEEERFPEWHPEWQHLAVDGNAVHPQRRPAWHFGNTFATEPYLHRFTGKMLLVENALDGTNWPAHGHNYATRARANLGAAADDSFRLYWTDRAAHGPGSMYPPGPPPVVTTRVIDYAGIIYCALRDLVAWVEDDVTPPAATGYGWGRNGRLTLAPTAAERGGLQPVATLRTPAGDRADVRVGAPVAFEAVAEAPAGTGGIVLVEWDFEGAGAWSDQIDALDGSRASVRLSATHAFTAPGTYFPAVRVWSQRDGDPASDLWRCANIGRARVVVT